MKKQYIKLEFGRGSVICECILSIDCPNFCGGISDIHLQAAEHTLWTGDTHLRGEYFSIPFGNITKILTRDTLQEHEGGPWITVWAFTKPFTYEQYYEAANILNKIQHENFISSATFVGGGRY